MKKHIFYNTLIVVCSLVFSFLVFLATAVEAQISIGSKGSAASNFVADEATAKRLEELRSSIIQSPKSIEDLVLPKVHPFEHEGIDLARHIKEIVEWSPIMVGCGEEGDVVGFYSPLAHVWVLLELNSDGELTDAAMARGFPLSETQPGWWPFLIEKAGGIPAALRADAAIQLTGFTSTFGETCSPVSSAPSVSSTQAVEQLNAVSAEVIEPADERKAVFKEDIKQQTGTNVEDWDMRYRLPNTGDQWIVLFTSSKFPGAVLVSRWLINQDEGLAHYQGSAVVKLLEVRENAQ